jgi:hypothetical protein
MEESFFLSIDILEMTLPNDHGGPWRKKPATQRSRSSASRFPCVSLLESKTKGLSTEGGPYVI